MDIFKKIGQWLLGKGEAQAPTSQPQVNPGHATHASDDLFQNNLVTIRKIVDRIAGNFGSDANLGSFTLYVLSDDALQLNRLSSPEFIGELKDRIANSLASGFKAIETDMLSAVYPGATRVDDGVYVFVKTEEARGLAARIEPLPGSGSLTVPFVEIAEEGVYNIGVGERVALNSGQVRVNKIAISADENDQEYERNKYVSRTHAHIVFSEADGFLLHVELPGTSIRNKRTRIIRGDKTIDMVNPMMPCRLAHGDIIELSKSVCLSFTFVK